MDTRVDTRSKWRPEKFNNADIIMAIFLSAWIGVRFGMWMGRIIEPESSWHFALIIVMLLIFGAYISVSLFFCKALHKRSEDSEDDREGDTKHIINRGMIKSIVALILIKCLEVCFRLIYISINPFGLEPLRSFLSSYERRGEFGTQFLCDISSIDIVFPFLVWLLLFCVWSILTYNDSPKKAVEATEETLDKAFKKAFKDILRKKNAQMKKSQQYRMGEDFIYDDLKALIKCATTEAIDEYMNGQ